MRRSYHLPILSSPLGKRHLERLLDVFHDVYQLSQEPTIDQVVLKKAIEETFKQRQTPLNDMDKLFQPEFLEDKDKAEQWQAYW